MEKILLAQFIAHIMADFFAQPENICRGKQNKCLASWHIYAHILIVFMASLAMTFTYDFVWYAAAIAIIHFAIDALKCIVERWLKNKKRNSEKLYTNPYLFLADQILHIVLIYGVVAMYWRNHHYTPYYVDLLTVNQWLMPACFLLCMKPTNVIIRICLLSLNLPDLSRNKDDSNVNKDDLDRAGRWIGSIERIIVLVLVLLQQYTAIGFIIAAKSVLRYKDGATGKTEYVLIGTLLSFGIAILIGIGIKEGVFESLLNVIPNEICV